MQITYDLPNVFRSDSTEVENSYALRALLEGLIWQNMGYLLFNKAKPLYHAGVRYGRTEIWDNIPALYARGYGDCKSLSAALVAQYRMQGIFARPVHRWIKNGPEKGNRLDYHILVQTNSADGKPRFEDPSKALGMGQNENSWFEFSDRRAA